MKLYISLIALLFSLPLAGQSVFVPYNKDYYHLIERYEIKKGSMIRALHSSVLPMERKDVAEFAEQLSEDTSGLSASDCFNINYLKNDSWEWTDTTWEDPVKKPVLKHFYRRKSDFYYVRQPEFDLHINPVLYLQGGRESGNPETPYINTRGVEVRGIINRKVGFYTFVGENQALFPTYVTQFIRSRNAVPGEGFWKPFKTGNAVDFITGRGYITFNATKNIALQFGHDKNYIGDGYRSLILSDFSSNYTFLKINTNIWRINYMNLFAEMTADVTHANVVFPKKHFALHHLTFQVTKNLTLGIFEASVIQRGDSLRNSTFDINYLNPVIFYRSIEQQLGSADNALLGMNYKWNLLRRFSLYGQIVLDEFVLSEVRSRSGWWANKQAVQAGVKYIDVAKISNLDLQLETNIVRPYTYAHFSPRTAYTHYQQPLAHPMGANFKEYLAVIRYQPIPRLNLVATMFYVHTGRDVDTTNWGSNIMLNYTTFEQEYNNRIGQGIATTIKFFSLTASYQIKHNLFLDLTQTVRRLDSALPQRSSSEVISALALRWNIARRLHEF